MMLIRSAMDDEPFAPDLDDLRGRSIDQIIHDAARSRTAHRPHLSPQPPSGARWTYAPNGAAPGRLPTIA
jgi:hypothetical protein